MDEYTSPVLAEPATSGNLTDIIVLNAAEVPQKVAFRRRSGDQWLGCSRPTDPPIATFSGHRSCRTQAWGAVRCRRA